MDALKRLGELAERAMLDAAARGGPRSVAYMRQMIRQSRELVAALGSASAAAGRAASDLKRERERTEQLERRAQGAERALVTGIVDPPADHLWATTGQVERDVAGVPAGRLYCATCTLKADSGVVLAAQCLGIPRDVWPEQPASERPEDQPVRYMTPDEFGRWAAMAGRHTPAAVADRYGKHSPEDLSRPASRESAGCTPDNPCAWCRR